MFSKQPLSPEFAPAYRLLHCTVQQTEEARETGGHPHDDGCGRLSSPYGFSTDRDQATKPDGLKIWILGYLAREPQISRQYSSFH